MKAFFLLLMLSMAPLANAQTVPVKSGEHGNFSRLVLTFPKLREWSLFREDDGYQLIVAGTKPTYDLSDVFRRLSAARLTRIYSDNETGALRLILDCNCHALPFELRDGILVVDIYDGPAPEGSSFELGPDGKLYPPLFAKTLPQPNSPAPVEIVDLTMPTNLPSAIAEASRLRQDQMLNENFEKEPALDKMRADLLWQLSKGVAESVVDVSKTVSSSEPKEPIPTENLEISNEASMIQDSTSRLPDQMTGAGNPCVLDSQLDIENWADGSSVASGFSANTTGLVQEFDHPETSAISRAVRYYLALGFGAEARLTLNAFKPSPPDHAIWEAMSYILDLETPLGDSFFGMEVCDNDAALWAALAKPEIPPTKRIAIPAILRTFSALPLHLRRHLGPGLASRFLARNDITTARAIRDAILRAQGEAGLSVQLMEAEINLANGHVAMAQESLSSLSGGASPAGVESTVALIQTQVGAHQEVQADLTITAEAYLQEAKGGADESILRNALVLAYASQNRFEDAFELVPPNDINSLPIWEILADHGNDGSILAWAIIPEAKEMPSLPSQTIQRLSRRLLDLGFPDQAILWLKLATRENSDISLDERLLAAEAEIDRNDNLAALSQLDNQTGEEVNRLRAKALAAMNDIDAVKHLGQSGQLPEAAHAAKQQRKWSELAELKQGDIWQSAVALTKTVPLREGATGLASQLPDDKASQLGPLAQSRTTLNESAKAREILNQLLADRRN